MTKDAEITMHMLQELATSQGRLEKLQEGITSQGLSLDIDRMYDGFTKAAELLGQCYVTASKEEAK